jgi:formate dehydrogenase major subunit
LVVQELFLTETAQLADVVLPARAVGERDGAFTNLERRVQAFDAGVPAPGRAWADWLILTALAGQMGAEDWTYASADGVMAEITRTVPLYAGMEFENLTAPVSLERKTSHYIYEGMSFTADVREGLQWPTLAEDEAGPTIPLRFIAPVEPPRTTEGLTLAAPRMLYDGGRLLAETALLENRLQTPHLRLSRADANRLGVSSGEAVTVSQNGHAVTVPVRIDRQVNEGIVLLPRNLAARPAEKLVGPGGVHTTVEVKKRLVAQ